MEAWRTCHSQVALDHPVLRVERASRRLADGPLRDFIVLHSPDWVNILPITPQGQVVLIRQWRQGSAAPSLEIPGGIIDPGESPEQAGARELLEETGYAAPRLLRLGQVNPNPALFSNICHSYLALEARPQAPPRPDDDERIEVLTRPVADLPELVRQGVIDHSLVLSALCFFWLAGGWPPREAGV
ncbi:MAG: NUDIX hydrolase [Pseudomonadota bacterium]